MTSEETIKKLVKIAKRKCKITWDDETTDAEILEIVESANAAIKRKTGLSEGTDDEIFLEPGSLKALWKEYCLYAWNDSVDEFDKAYLEEIMQERRENEVRRYAEKKKNKLLQ